MDLLIDLESFSTIDLEACGVKKYTTCEHLQILCMGYKEFDPQTFECGETKLWTFFDPHELQLLDYKYIWALNSGFDYSVYRAVQARFPKSPSSMSHPITLPFQLSKWKDIQVVLSRFSLPQNLADAAEVLKTPHRKNPEGKALIKKCCKPGGNPTRDDYERLFNYCKDDIDASFEVLKSCPSLSIPESEWQLWRETYEMNSRGIPIQFDAVRKIKERCDTYKAVIQEELPALTNGMVSKPTQTKRIKDFLNSRLKPKGIEVPDTTADTLNALIERDDNKPFLPSACRTLIEIRQAAGASSVAKFDKLLDMQVGDRVHDFLRYGATNTQRWAGAGYQVHSLPKKKVKDPEALIQAFLDDEYIENPIQSGKALCRAVIKAPPGQMIYQADYSSIEYLLLIWITDMHEMLEMFKQGRSAYIDMAAYLFNKPYEAIDKEAIDNYEYFLGKQVILGCGYQMGDKKFKATCERFGVIIPIEVASMATKGYKKKYAPIEQMWINVHRACIAAIQNPGQRYEVCKCSFVCQRDHKGTNWLIITLPSGSKLFYCTPSLAKGTYGYEIKHMGLHNYKWVSRYLSPGRITENIIQKLARDLMGYSLLSVAKDDNQEFELLMTVHDEAVSLGPEDNPEERHKRYLDLILKRDTWAQTIPLKAGGYYGKRYKKD